MSSMRSRRQDEKKRSNGVFVISAALMLMSAAIIAVIVLCFGGDIYRSHTAPGGMQPELAADSVYAIVGLLLIACFAVTMVIFAINILRPLLLVERTLRGQTENGEYKQYNFSKQMQADNAFCRLYMQLNTMIEKNRDMAVREYSLQMLKKQAELAALQSQINPHFLYNTLDCIRGIAIEQGADNIEEMSKALSDMFRYSISGKQMQVRLCDELANMHNYLTIQQYRFNNKLNVREEIDVDTRECTVPKLIIQPIVENAVFYGLEPKMGSRNMTIRAYRTHKRLIINIEDNGIGIAPEKSCMINDALSTGTVIASGGKGTKMGLTNVNERIKLLYGGEFGIKVYSCVNVGTNVEITLPIECNEAQDAAVQA